MINPIIEQEGGDILTSARFQMAWETPHHKGTSVASHSLSVTNYAIKLYFLEKKPTSSLTDVVRACLLHDIGMTDEEVFRTVSFLKAYSHPKRSAEIAAQEFNANHVQVEAILHHMWPVCIVPPQSLAGWLLLRADKHCSFVEIKERFFPEEKQSQLPSDTEQASESESDIKMPRDGG